MQEPESNICPKHSVPPVLRQNLESGDVALACLICDVEAHGGGDKELRIIADAMKEITGQDS